MEADIVIIGAGLAGLSAASTIAASSRAAVVVLDRRGVGSNNPTPMTFADVPPRYGLEDCTIGAYRCFTFHSPLGGRSSHEFGQAQLVALDYRRACQTLLSRAASEGAVWHLPSAAAGMSRQENGWQVKLDDGSLMTAPLVIDASGRGLFSSRQLGLPRPKSYSHCYGARLSGCRVPDPSEAFFFAPCRAYGDGGGWLYPLDGGQASYGWATLGDTPTLPGGVIKDNFRRSLNEFEPYASWLKDAVWEHVEVGSIPIYPLKRFVYDGLLVAGDAAGQATIWSCMGSEAALEAGQLAGDAAAAALVEGDFSAAALATYQEHWDRRNRDTYRRNTWVAPTVWSQSEADWNRQIPRVASLTPEQMLARLRVNWPAPTFPQAAFVRAYDLAGRTRRGLVKALRRPAQALRQ